MKYLLIFFIVPISIYSQSFQHDLDRILQQEFTPNQPGAAVLILQNGTILYKKAIGLRDVEKKKQLTATSNFRMASVSKQFTAMAILLLEKQGNLSLDDSLTKFFPDFASVGSSITLRQLLTHSSGIWDYETVMPDDLQEQLSDADVLKLIQDIDKTYFPPGTDFRYSNSGFCLLTLVVEKVSGQSFAQFVKEAIFEPLGMKHSRLYEAKARIKNRAYGYARNDAGKLIFSDQSLTSATKGDGGVYTSLEDYQKWHEALLTNRLVNIEEALKATQVPLPDKSGGYGLGWFFNEQGEFFHSGSTCGFSNIVVRNPKKGVLVACFSNIAGNHEAFKPVFDYLKKSGLVQADIWAWHNATN